MRLARKDVLLAFVVLLVLLVVAGAALAAKPTRSSSSSWTRCSRGTRPAYDMDNILWLQNHGVNFKNATVGDMASETVVSHNTIVSGLFPKHMGWSDEVIRDTEQRPRATVPARSSPSATSPTTSSRCSSRPRATPSSATTCTTSSPGTVVANFGGKYYQVASTAASSSDIWVTYGSKKQTSALPSRPSSRGPARTVARPAATCPPTSRTTTASRSAPATTSRPPARLRRRTTTTAPRRRRAGLPLPRGRALWSRVRTRPPEWRRLGRRRRHQGHRERGLVRPPPELQRHRQDRSHVGRRHRRHGRHLRLGSDTIMAAGPHAVDRQERRRPGRQGSSRR